jgi:hypothetical protein
MGFNTVAIILNDQVHDAAKQPDFGQQVVDAVSGWYGRSRRPFAAETRRGGLRVVSQAHADYTQVVIVSCNCARALSMGDTPLPGDLEALASILRVYGWRATAPAKKDAPR